MLFKDEPDIPFENPAKAPLLVVIHSLNRDGRGEMLKKLPSAIVMPGAWLISFFDEEGNLNKAYGGSGSETGLDFLI